MLAPLVAEGPGPPGPPQAAAVRVTEVTVDSDALPGRHRRQVTSTRGAAAGPDGG